jgi:hypothetical protein
MIEDLTQIIAVGMAVWVFRGWFSRFSERFSVGPYGNLPLAPFSLDDASEMRATSILSSANHLSPPSFPL